MKDDEKKLVILTQKVDQIHDTTEHIRKQVDRINGSVQKHEGKIIKLEANQSNHFRNHDKGRSWVMWIPSALAVIIAIIALIK